MFNTTIKSISFFAFLSMAIVSCDSGPKVISTPVNNTATEGSTGIFSDSPADNKVNAPSINNNAVHTVVVEEVLEATKYVYLFVKEGEEKFWIATAKRDVHVGDEFQYQGGLLKTNFESKEHNRVFDKIYLVSRLINTSHDHNHNHDHTTETTAAPENKKTTEGPRNIVKEGSIRIADIVDNPQKYAGKTVQVSGECVKINPNIMSRNWIHLKDGSKDDYDLVITSDIMVPEGHVVTMTATVTLDKDFGAGYRYDIILENGVMVK